MLQLPPLPSWPNIHPLVVHLPIGALLLAPLMMFIGLFPLRTSGFRWAALLLMICGSIGCFVAVQSGEAASDAGEIGLIDGADQVVSQHEELAEKTMVLFMITTAAYGGVLAMQHFWKESRKLVAHLATHGILLIATSVGLLMIANVGHLGGKLVHQYGVHAQIADAAPTNSDASRVPAAETEAKDHE